MSHRITLYSVFKVEVHKSYVWSTIRLPKVQTQVPLLLRAKVDDRVCPIYNIFELLVHNAETTRHSVEHCTPHADGAWLNELGWSQ